jgi:uncharacterized repeat protein (TIGR02543 family)
VREYYDFLGWYFKGEPEEEQEGCIGLEIGSFGDFEMYAKWAPTTYYITYVLNGGENAEENPAKYNIETPDFYFASPKDRPGYTFDGWYLDESFTEESYLEGVATGNFGDFEVYAKWTVHTDTKYTVIYYWQNIEDDNYTPHESIELTGTTDTPTAEVEIKEYEHFSYNASKSVTSGNIDGDGSRVLSVYYTRNTYSLSINISDAGAITNSGTYKYGKEITTEATPYLGYEFIGWYRGDELLSTDNTYTFIVDKNVTAKFVLKAEMSNFNFISFYTFKIK